MRRRGWRELGEGLEQRHLDVLGLALVAAAIYLAFVIYLGWDGGRVGSWLETGLENAAGQVTYLVPVALFAGGAVLIARPMLNAPSALNAGGILVIAALLLAFAAETAGLGPESPSRQGYFDQRFMIEHGGAVGEALYWSAATLFQRIGAHILALLLLISGALLLTQTTIAGMLGATGRAVRAAGSQTREVSRAVRARRGGADGPKDLWAEAPGADIAVTRAQTTEAFATDDEEAEEATIALEDGDAEWGEGEGAPEADEFAYQGAGSREREGRGRGRREGRARDYADGKSGGTRKGSLRPMRSPTGCRRRRRSSGARRTRGQTCAIARRPPRRCSSRCAISGSRHGCWAPSAAHT